MKDWDSEITIVWQKSSFKTEVRFQWDNVKLAWIQKGIISTNQVVSSNSTQDQTGVSDIDKI